MKIFISWSGEASKEMARILKEHIQLVFQNVVVWYSEEDIMAGEKGLSLIERELKESDFGISCITPENQTSPWLNFEAGALSKNFERGRVMPVILGMKLSDMINGPIKQFQVREMSSEGILSVLESINSVSKYQRPEQQIRTIHESLWPRISQRIGEISLSYGIESKRTLEDKIDEVLSYHTSGYGGYEELLREQHQLSLRMYDLLRLLSSDRLADSSTVKSLLLSSVSMQARAFLKPSKLKISNDNQQIILSYDARGTFHARQLLTRMPELEEAVTRLLGDTYEIIVVSNGETLWPATPLLD